MLKLNIGIAGTRGIPNHYGGFEQITSHLAAGLVDKGHTVTVYNSHNHPFTESEWNGVHIVHCYDPEYRIGTAGQFIYDLNCLMDARERNFDILLFMGYTSSSLWGRLYPENSTIITNMDGLEWKRSKYSAPVRYFLKYAEKLAIKYSDHYIADSVPIQKYLEDTHSIESHYIPYGAEILPADKKYLTDYNLTEHNYFMLMARMEPENNIEMILDGFHQSNSEKHFLIVGNVSNPFGQYLTRKYNSDNRILFAGAIFDKLITSSLQTWSHMYFHGHSVGGTNPSLLEAMAGQALIAAHDNSFNEAVLGTDANYFSSSTDVQLLISTVKRHKKEDEMMKNNLMKIQNIYCWDKIITQYEQLLCECHQSKRYETTIYYR